MLEFVIDLFFPTGSGKLTHRIAEAASGDAIPVESWRAGAIKRTLNESAGSRARSLPPASCVRERRRRWSR